MLNPAETLAPLLNPAMLYEGDGGRLFCGAPSCAGTSAAYTGLGLSGHPVHAVTLADQRAFLAAVGRPPACEGCGLVALGILTAGGQMATRAAGA